MRAEPELLNSSCYLKRMEGFGGQHHCRLYKPHWNGCTWQRFADLGFELYEGTGISNVEYNPSFDSDFFGPADLSSHIDDQVGV